MVDASQKPNEDQQQFERLSKVYGSTYKDRPFRPIGQLWERFKSDMDHGGEDVYGKRVDVTKPVTAEGNFAVWDRDRKDYLVRPFEEFYYYVVIDGDKKFIGRLVDFDAPPWADGNFQVKTADGWKPVDYNTLTAEGSTAKIERVAKIKRVQNLPAVFKDVAQVETKKGVKEYRRVNLEMGQTASEAFENAAKMVTKLGGVPGDFWFTFRYIEAKKQYVIDPDMITKLTDEEKEQCAAQDAASRTSALSDLTPSDDIRIEDIPF